MAKDKVITVSEKIKDKIRKLRNTTWQGIDKQDPGYPKVKNIKTFGPKSDKQIGWELKLNEATVASIK